MSEMKLLSDNEIFDVMLNIANSLTEEQLTPIQPLDRFHFIAQAQLDADLKVEAENKREMIEELERLSRQYFEGRDRTRWWKMTEAEWQTFKAKWGKQE